MLTQWFDPEPAFKGLLFARALRDAGHEVQVITGFPNYPGGTLYPGYRVRWRQREILDGIAVLRVALYPSHDSSALGRVFNYVSFAASATLAGLTTRFQPDVAYVYHPPLTVGVAAAVVGLFRRVPFVYDVQDLWPDTLQATGMFRNRAGIKIIGWAADWVYRRAAVVVAQSPGFRQRLLARGVPERKLRLIRNWCDEAALSRRATLDTSRLSGRFNVVFAGNMGKAQGLEAVLAAADLVRAQAPDVQFVFVGGGTDVELLRARAAALENVLFVPRLPTDQVGTLLDAADVLLVHLRRSTLFSITLPSKIQAYLFQGKPILVAVDGDASDLVREAGAGVIATPEDPADIARAVLELRALAPEARAAMGQRGRDYYLQHLSVDTGVSEMIETFKQARRDGVRRSAAGSER